MTKAEQMIYEYKMKNQPTMNRYEPKHAAKPNYTPYYIVGAVAAVLATGLGVFFWKTREVA